MVSKRQSHQEGNGRDHHVPIHESKRRRGDQKQEAISALRNVINGVCMNDLASYLEPFLRRVVREEVERIIQHHQFPRTTLNQTGISGAHPLELRFVGKLPRTIFTLSNITAEDEAPLQIVLFDVRSQSAVNDGPLSSIKIEICALDGDFGSNGSEDWTEVEFNANILRERDGKGPLLNGDRFVTLKDGVGCITKLTFTDNSSWRRSRQFRLGAKIVQPFANGTNIKGGRSEPFIVKDNRGELYKKHYPPSLSDDIWRLEKISKDGKIHNQLSSHGIKTVRDLLQLCIINPSSLYEKFGRIPKKSWLAITEHAKACVIDDYELYIYHTAEQPIGLLFNSIYLLVGVTFDGQNYCSTDSLTPNQKHLVEIVKQHAYNNLNSLKSVDQTSFNFLRSLECLQTGQAGAPDQNVQQFSFPTEQQGLNEPFNSSSNVDEGVDTNQAYADPLPELRELPRNSSSDGDISSGMYTEGNAFSLTGSQWPTAANVYSIENDSSQVQFTSCYSPSTLWGQGNGFHIGFCDGAEPSNLSPFPDSAVDISSSRKPKAVWYKIRAALKWVISVRRDAASRRMAKLLYYNY